MNLVTYIFSRISKSAYTAGKGLMPMTTPLKTAHSISRIEKVAGLESGFGGVYRAYYVGGRDMSEHIYEYSTLIGHSFAGWTKEQWGTALTYILDGRHIYQLAPATNTADPNDHGKQVAEFMLDMQALWNEQFTDAPLKGAMRVYQPDVPEEVDKYVVRAFSSLARMAHEFQLNGQAKAAAKKSILAMTTGLVLAAAANIIYPLI